MSYDVIVKSGSLFREFKSKQVVLNSKIEQIGPKINEQSRKLKRLTGILFCTTYAIQEDRPIDRIIEFQNFGFINWVDN